MTTEEAIRQIALLIPHIKEEEISTSRAEAKALVLTLWMTLRRAQENASRIRKAALANPPPSEGV